MATSRTVLITGASGALGSAVTEAFQRQGDRVVAASHPDYD
ncbi:MAG: NAD-dependent epimerase/dehydratase family protein, partial [Terriglobales bacterium]